MRVTTRNFDERARSYVLAKARKDSAEQEMKDLKDPFVAFLKKHGKIPESGKKSFAYEALYRAIASFGQTTVIDADVVDSFRKAFNARGRAVSFGEIFEERTSYVAMPGALLAVEKLPKKLQRLYRRSQLLKPLSPSLKVERAKPADEGEHIPKRQPRRTVPEREAVAV